MSSTAFTTSLLDSRDPDDAVHLAAAFLAGFRSPDTRKSYRRDLRCWLEFCAAHSRHPYRGVRHTRWSRSRASTR
jgi:hypothetical protein